MDLRQLAYVEAVARVGSFTGAARELHVAQPAVSAQIAALERRLGTPLFVRIPTGAVATDAGQRIAERARRVQAEIDGARADIDHLNGLLTGTLSLGATPLLGAVDLPAVISRFHGAHPAVRIRVRTDLISNLLTDLDHGRLDVVVGPIDGGDLTRLRSTVLHEESLTLIVPKGFASRLADLRDQPFICLPQGSGLRRLLDAACLRQGFTPRVDIELSDPRDIPAYVEGGLGAALVATSIAEHHRSRRITASTLREGLQHPPIGLITGDRPTACATAFAAELTCAGR